MPDRKPIAFDDFNANPFQIFDKKWFLLTCGDFSTHHFNSMTISWGSLGIMWNKPFAQVVVRPTRYTFDFMNRYEGVTLCCFGEEHRSALSLLGSKSGRDGDKIRESGLTPIASQLVSAPGFAEAELILECKKMYWQDYDQNHFLLPEIESKYPQKDYHRVFFGEILSIFGTGQFRRRARHS